MLWYAKQLDELSDDLFAESATLYSEFGVALQDGLREVSRHLRSSRLLACGQVLRPVEKLLTQACLAPRDDGEREWLSTVRSLLHELRERSLEVQEALREFQDNEGSLGWRSAGESMGAKTEWREDEEDGSLWVRMAGDVSGAKLLHAAAVAHEAELWPRWVPFCTAGETLDEISPTERITYVQLDLGGGATSMMRRGAVLHWSLSDSLAERQSLLLLGASLDESSPVEKPASAGGVSLCEVRCLKALVSPRTATSASVQWVLNVDLKAKMPAALVSMVTKKIAGAILPLLAREAQKLSTLDAEAEPTAAGGAAAGAAAAADNPYLRQVAEGGGGFYAHVDGLFRRYFEMFGEEESEEEDDDDEDSQEG